MVEVVDVLTVGESMGAVRADGLIRNGATVRLSIAGTEGNVAIGLARLGHRARWAGVVGDDQIGALVLRTLRAEGVDVSHARVDADAPTGIMVYEERIAGLIQADYHRRGSAATHLTVDDVVGALAGPPQFLHVTGVTMALGDGPARAVGLGIRQARQRGVKICLDVNHRGRLWSTARARDLLGGLIGSLDVVVASDDELTLLAPGAGVEEQARWLLERGVTEVVVKLGAAGATAYTREEVLRCQARSVVVADTVGAGDGFVAGYLSGALDGLPVRQRLERANAVGAFVVGTRGDWEGLPTRRELSMLDQRQGEVVR